MVEIHVNYVYIFELHKYEHKIDNKIHVKYKISYEI